MNTHGHDLPSSSSYSVYGRTPPWCLHKLAAAGGIRKTCACPRAACERGSTCESSLSAGTPQTGDLQKECRRRHREEGAGARLWDLWGKNRQKTKQGGEEEEEWVTRGVNQESKTGLPVLLHEFDKQAQHTITNPPPTEWVQNIILKLKGGKNVHKI